MSKENVKKFFEELEKNPVLKAKFQKSLIEGNEEMDNKKMSVQVIDFAKESGFSFAEKDLMALYAEFKDNANGNDELNDEDLRTAAGGGINPIQVLSAFLGQKGHFCGLSINPGKCR